MDVGRIVTLDPTGTAGRVVRGALGLLDMVPVQVDAPSAELALSEVERGATLLVVAYDLDESNGAEVAWQAIAQNPQLPVIVLGDEETPFEDDAPYILMRIATDAVMIVKVIEAALTTRDVRSALRHTQAIPTVAETDIGSVPSLDVTQAQKILDRLQIDVGSLATILATRTGETVLERGAVGSLDRDRLISLLAPTVKAGRDVKDVVGGQLSSIQFYDGETFDVFVLSVGLHHFLCVVYDGNGGSRQFGAVNRFGRRAAEDVIALIGANAFIWQATHIPDEPSPARSTMRMRAVKNTGKLELPLEAPLAKAELVETSTPAPDESAPKMEPIADLDLDALFGSEAPEDSDADGLFDLDALEDISKSSQPAKGKLSWDQAKEIGLIS